jgi:hypothetical protein
MCQQTSQQSLIDAAAKSLTAIHDHDGHALVVTRLKGGIGIDVDRLEIESVSGQYSRRIVAEVATGAGV